MSKRERNAMIGVVFVSVMWGLSFVGSKIAMSAGLQPFSLVMLRFLAASVFLFPLALLTKTSLKISLRDVPWLFLIAMSGTTVYFFFELNGLKQTSAATASLIIALIPVFTMLSELVFRRQKPTVLQWIGTAVSLIGVWLVVGNSAEGNTLSGLLLMLCACICWVIYGEATDHLLKRLPTLTITCWQSLFSLLTLIPLCFTENVPWQSVTAEAWIAACVFLGLICSGICYILYNYSIAIISTGRTAIFLNLNPIAGVIGSVIILHESFTLIQAAGGLLILFSLFLVNRKAAGRSAELDGGTAPMYNKSE